MRIELFLCPACGKPQKEWTRRWQTVWTKPTCKHCGFIITDMVSPTIFTTEEFNQYMKELKSGYKKDDPPQQSMV